MLVLDHSGRRLPKDSLQSFLLVASNYWRLNDIVKLFCDRPGLMGTFLFGKKPILEAHDQFGEYGADDRSGCVTAFSARRVKIWIGEHLDHGVKHLNPFSLIDFRILVQALPGTVSL